MLGSARDGVGEMMRRVGSASPTVTVGIVHYAALDDLAACLASLETQTLPPLRVRVYDVIEDGPALPTASTRDALARFHPRVEWLRAPNVGFAAAANRLLDAEASRTTAAQPGADVQLILNADIALDASHLERLAAVFAREPGVAIAGGKLLRPGRERIDSAGIRLPLHARPRDRGSEELDVRQWEREEDVFAVSGAAMALRTRSLDGLALAGEVFDERFFMYHEDTDLCWRAARLGMRVRYVPSAVAVHRRGWRRDERFRMPPAVRRHSFKNHYLQLVKNETGVGFVRRMPALLVWEALRLGFVVLRDRALLAGYVDALRALPDAWRKRRLLVERASRLSSTKP